MLLLKKSHTNKLYWWQREKNLNECSYLNPIPLQKRPPTIKNLLTFKCNGSHNWKTCNYSLILLKPCEKGSYINTSVFSHKIVSDMWIKVHKCKVTLAKLPKCITSVWWMIQWHLKHGYTKWKIVYFYLQNNSHSI